MEVFGPFNTIRSDEKLENNTVHTQLPEKCQDFQEKYKLPESVNTYNFKTALISLCINFKTPQIFFFF